MAIAAGRRLSDRLFGGLEGAKADYNNVPVRNSVCNGLLSSLHMVVFMPRERKRNPAM